MNFAIYAVAGFLIATKLLDVFTTLRKIRTIDQETNPYARALMQKMGVKPAVYLVLIVALGIIFIATHLALGYGLLMQIIFVVVGFWVGIVQAAVAINNYTGKPNFITLLFKNIFQKIQR